MTDKNEIWKHNSFMGHAKMMQAQCSAIINSRTATDKAKGTAKRIFTLAVKLADEIKIRKDKT